MLSFNKYFLNESPTIIRYGTRNIPMDDSVITFIVTESVFDGAQNFDAYIYQTINRKLPPLFHIDDNFQIQNSPDVNSTSDGFYHDKMGSIFGLDMGIENEDDYVRGRLWVDPKNEARMLVSMWTFKEDFERKFKSFFEKLVKKINPKAKEFAYEHYLSNSKGIDFAPNDKDKVEQTQVDKWKKEKAELLAKWHTTASGPERNIIKVKIQDLNKKIGIKQDPFEAMKVTKTYDKPSWMRREGD